MLKTTKSQKKEVVNQKTQSDSKLVDYVYEYVVDPVAAKCLGLSQVQIEEARRNGGVYKRRDGLYAKIELSKFDQLNTPSWVQVEPEWELIRPNLGHVKSKSQAREEFWIITIKSNAAEFAKWESILEGEGMPAELPLEADRAGKLGFKTSRILVQLRANIDRINTDKLGRASRKLILNLAQVEMDWLESAEMPELARGLGYTSSRGLQKAVEGLVGELKSNTMPNLG